ncbi:MAG: C25 family cysteine peptidase [Chloroflexaceae bacterium]|jgi:hypothetical protein|nr:C25 family cysteine peptidase [Chloroflexaceae bacterium]
MHILLTSREHLAASYADRALTRILAALHDLQWARTGRGLPTYTLLVEAGWPELVVPPADPTDPLAISEQLAAVAAALAQQDTRIESVLLVGGPAIVPFHCCINPIPDNDADIPSDVPYSGPAPFQLPGEWPVGRLPDGGDGNPAVLLRLLRLATHFQRSAPRPLNQAVGLSTAAWQQASAEVYQALSQPLPLFTSPSLAGDSFQPALLQGAARIYFNLHGVRHNPCWYGQRADRAGQLVVALRPEDVDGLRLTRAVVMSEACYGAYSPAVPLREGLALRFLLRGAASFVGATTLTYGPATPPLSEADLLARCFLEASLQPGISAGEALLLARQRMLRQILQRYGMLDDDSSKTALQFILYGDPTIVIGVA